MQYNTTASLKIRIDTLLDDIKKADANYSRWQQNGFCQLASLYRKELDRLFIELADVNISFQKERTSEELHRILTCTALNGMGISYHENDGLIYI